MQKRKVKISEQEAETAFIQTFKSVLAIFSEIQDATTVSKTLVMDLAKVHQQDPQNFDISLKQAYIKIFKGFHDKANKKIPTKFENIAEMLFKELLKSISKETEQSVKNSVNSFLHLLSEAMLSSIMNIRIMSSRLAFLVLKTIPAEHLSQIVSAEQQQALTQSVRFLTQNKVSTYRQLGVKLSSLVLLFPMTPLSEALENILFNILSTEQNDAIRKMVMVNIPFSKHNIEKVLVRLRDKNPQIKATLLRRLLSDKFSLEEMSLEMRYKLLFDGYGTKDVICKEEALRYFADWFLKDKEILNPRKQNINSENKMEIEDQNINRKSGRLFPLQKKFDAFIQLFEPNLLLINSHLYVLFDKLIGELLSFLPVEQTSEYIRRLCRRAKCRSKNEQLKELSFELIWLKNASNPQIESKDIYCVFEEYCPSGTDLSESLEQFVKKRNIFAINEFLQLFSNLKMPDQVGRNKMFDQLIDTLVTLPYFKTGREILQNMNPEDDVCNIQTEQKIRMKKLLLSYYDIPIISDSFDLIYYLIVAMKSLRPNREYILKLQESIAEWTGDNSHNADKRQIISLNLNKLKNDKPNQRNQDSQAKNKRLMLQLENQLEELNLSTEEQRQKRIRVLIALGKIEYNWTMENYLSDIKKQMSGKDTTQGLTLLSLYCLQKLENIKLYFNIFWGNIMQNLQTLDQDSFLSKKQTLLISLKAVTDYIVKFNILNQESFLNETSSQEEENYNSDIFMKRLTNLILHKDTDIRIFAIECLCRIIYHNRVDENNLSMYFLYLLLLWWETSAQEVSAKSVHTISLFFRSYLEKGKEQVRKLSEMLCIFHKILKIFEHKNKTINKKLIVYNLKIGELLKKTASIGTTVLKYHKEKKTIWEYEEPELGPQQLFLLYLLYEPGFQNILQKPVNICDFYTRCPIETLVFVKKKLEDFEELVQADKFYPNSYIHDKTVTKKTLEELNRFEKDIENHIHVKNEVTFNQEIINSMQKVFAESAKYINEEAKRIAKNIEEEEIFINMEDEDSEYEQDGDREIMSQSEGSMNEADVQRLLGKSDSEHSLSQVSNLEGDLSYESSHTPQQIKVQSNTISNVQSMKLSNRKPDGNAEKLSKTTKPKLSRNKGSKNTVPKQQLQQIQSERESQSDQEVKAQPKSGPSRRNKKKAPVLSISDEQSLKQEIEASSRKKVSSNNSRVRRSTRRI